MDLEATVCYESTVNNGLKSGQWFALIYKQNMQLHLYYQVSNSMLG